VWQGRCYSLDGEREIDGVVYRDFRTATGYGTGAGLCGWNCRHSFGPYRHGAPRQYEPNPVSETGYTDAELYALSQKQRACERAIRAAKRELVGARRLYESDPSVANQVAVEQARRKVADRQARVRKLVSDANARCAKGTALLRRPDREWVAGYEGAGKSEASGRTLDDALARPSATKRIQSAGTSRTAVRKKVAAAMANDGVSVRSFPSLTAKRQAAYIEAAIPKRLVDAKNCVREFHRARSLMVTDQNMFLTANSRASWAVSVAKAETKILEFAGQGYKIVKDHSGCKAISVLSSRGYVTVGAGALSHVEYDHPSENGRPGVTVRGIIDAIENPVGYTPTRLDDGGRPSYKAVGRSVTVAINPDTGEVVTAWGTEANDLKTIGNASSKKRRRNR
jgi:D-alanyl-D-alanine dipeptidase